MIKFIEQDFPFWKYQIINEYKRKMNEFELSLEKINCNQIGNNNPHGIRENIL